MFIFVYQNKHTKYQIKFSSKIKKTKSQKKNHFFTLLNRNNENIFKKYSEWTWRMVSI